MNDFQITMDADGLIQALGSSGFLFLHSVISERKYSMTNIHVMGDGVQELATDMERYRKQCYNALKDYADLTSTYGSLNVIMLNDGRVRIVGPDIGAFNEAVAKLEKFIKDAKAETQAIELQRQELENRFNSR